MFNCHICNYSTTRKFSFNRHQNGKNHIKLKELDDKNNLILNEQNVVPIQEPINNNLNCKKCYKSYKTKEYLINHESKCMGVNILTCSKCMFTFSNRFSKSKHLKANKCKPIIVPEKNKSVETQTDNILDLNINNKLINIILEKDKKLEILNKTIEENNYKIDNTIEKSLNQNNFIILNDITITSRLKDNYINATLLCQAGGLNFDNWYMLKSTKKLIEELEKSETDKSITNDDQYTWIHPDLSIQLAQWISPKFALHVSKWIRTLFTNYNPFMNQIIQEKERRIKLLENTYVKKHTRINYKDTNVIYMLTTKDYKDRRIYIIGKAIKLKNRLSAYNKTIDHEVVYYKSCKNEEQMNIVENVILLKLNKYQEVANRDRFILPLENDISLFTNIIDESINFLENY